MDFFLEDFGDGIWAFQNFCSLEYFRVMLINEGDYETIFDLKDIYFIDLWSWELSIFKSEVLVDKWDEIELWFFDMIMVDLEFIGFKLFIE